MVKCFCKIEMENSSLSPVSYSRLKLPLLNYVKRIKSVEKKVKTQNIKELEELFEKLCLNRINFDLLKKEKGKPETKKASSEKKHIHPCICDLSKQQWDKIHKFRAERDAAQKRFADRLEQIEFQLKVLEEEEEERRRLEEDYRDAWSERYGVDKKGKVHRIRSARRVSMVSLGVKQVINWKKNPRIAVKMNRAQSMRQAYAKVCPLTSATPFPEKEKIDFSKGDSAVEVPVNKAFKLRDQWVKNWIDNFNKKANQKPKYPDRPDFILSQYLLRGAF